MSVSGAISRKGEEADDPGGEVADGRGRGHAPGRCKQRKRNVLDDTQNDESEAYSGVMGKWSRRALKELKNPSFWIALRVSLRISDALDVLQWAIQ